MYTWMVHESNRTALYERYDYCTNPTRLIWANFQMPGAARIRLTSAEFVILRLLINDSELCRRFAFVIGVYSTTGSLGFHLCTGEY